MARLKGITSMSSPKRSSPRMGQKLKRKTPKAMGVLEMESETDGLLTSNGHQNESEQATWKMSNNQRKWTFLTLTLAILVGLFLLRTDEIVEAETKGVDETGHSELDHVELKPPKKFHTTSGSFGGVNNIAHPGGAKAAARGEGLAFEEIIIPKSNVGHAIPSIDRPNLVNSLGHYIHDEHRSPYASHLYDATREELEQRQQKYIEKMQKVREEWGAWDFRDPREDESNTNTSTPRTDDVGRSEADFTNAPYKDLPVEDFPPDSWQADEEYLGRFLDEAKKLVHRVKEGIYAEVGWPTKGSDEKRLEDREKYFKIHVWDPSDCETDSDAKNQIAEAEIKCGKKAKEGIAKFQKHAFDGLVKKLLHAMMTNDEFYAILGGHSAAAGHGNDFQQNRIITFHHLMEPVFDKLGMRLISRNMAMGGVGTLQFSLAGGDLYGETDILEWDSGMTERGPPVDLFNKQAILSGERVPVIMTNNLFDIMNESNETAWMGTYFDSKPIFPETTFDNCKSQPYAARWYNQKEEKYNAICWEPRSDFTPAAKQADHPGSQVGWHPGNRQHQWSGRKLALVLLEALQAAFELWEDGIAKNGAPLAASYWHVGDSYKVIRESVRTHINTPKPDEKEGDTRSECEKLMPWLPRVCRLQMHGFGMWWPRAHVEYDFLTLVHPAPNGYKPDFLEYNVYSGFDLLPLNQAIPDGDIDVHAIAIATTSAAPDLDHSYIDDDEVESPDHTTADEVANSTELPPPTRRWLREASELAQRKGAELFPSSTTTRQNSHQEYDTREATRSFSSSHNPMLRRYLQDDAANATAAGAVDDKNDIVAGRGWEVHGWTPVQGYCDGSAQSECNRHKGNDCMLGGANDKHLDVWGNSLSGWLKFTVPKVREGIILVRMEWWCSMGGARNQITKGWTEVNNGMADDTTPWNGTAHRAIIDASMANVNEESEHRNLKQTFEQVVPKDLEMDYAIDGVIKTMKYDEWKKYSKELGKNVAVWPFLNDISMAERDWEGAPVEVALRYRSKEKPETPFCVSHVYYA